MTYQKLAMTVEEAAQTCGIGRTSLYCAIRDGKLVVRKSGRRTLVLVTDLEAFLERLPVRKVK